MDHLVVSIGVAVAALFPIVDPIGNSPTFLSLTGGLSRAQRRRQADKAVVAALVMFLVFLTIGHFVLEYFGISLAAVEFIGGLVVAYTGWQMLTQRVAPPNPDDPDASQEIYFTPMAFPLLSGPGALAIVLAFSNRADDWADYPGFAIGIVLVLVITYICLVNADRLLQVIGPGGIDVINRLMGLIILLIAAELVFHGIADEFGIETTDA